MKTPKKLLRRLMRVAIKNRLDLVQKAYLNRPPDPSWGLCYVIAEAYYYLEGKALGYYPMHGHISVRATNNGHEVVNGTHWWLGHNTKRHLDPIVDSLYKKYFVYVEKIRYGGFLTSKPSKRAQKLIRLALDDGIWAKRSYKRRGGGETGKTQQLERLSG